MAKWALLRRFFTDRHSSLLLLLILAIAFGLRVWALSFDLPNLFHPDEDAVVMPALQILKTGNLEPNRFEYGSMQIYALTALFVIVYLYLARAGIVSDPTQLPIYERGTYPLTYPLPQFFLAARWLSALAGVGIVVLVYMLTKRLSDQRTALIAAAVAAVTPMLIDNAHYATPDTLLTFMCMLALYLLVRAYDNWETDSHWPFIAAAFIGGLATSTKYNGAVLLIPILLIPAFKNKSLDDYLSLRTVGAPTGLVTGFLFASPYALLNMPLFLQWAGYALRLYNQPAEAFAIPSWEWHLNYLLTSREMPVFFVGFLGFFFSVKLWGQRGWIVNSFAIIFTLAILTQTNRQPRMWLPLAPLFAIWAALFMGIVTQYVQNKITPKTINLRKSKRFRLLSTASFFMPLLLLVPALGFSFQVVNTLQKPDVRSVTTTWIQENIPAGETLAVDYFPPNVDTSTWNIVRTFRHSQHDLNWFLEQNVDYLIFSQGIYSEQRLPPAERPNYEMLLKQLCPVETVYGSFLSNPDFTMRLFHVPPCS